MSECSKCSARLHTWDEYVIRVPEGRGFAKYDSRPRTATGGRLGVGGMRSRMFFKTVKQTVCAGCALGEDIAAWPGKERFENRSKRHG